MISSVDSWKNQYTLSFGADPAHPSPFLEGYQMKIEFDTIDELKELIAFLGCLSIDEKQPKTAAERAKKYRENKNRHEKRDENVTECDEFVTKRDENVTQSQEEREEERAVSPLDSPLPFPPNTPNPITPLIPSSQKEEEREENILATVPKAKRDRGILLEFGEYVRLSQKEYLNLCTEFGKEKTEQMIRNMNDYIGEDETGKLARKYQTRNHNLTLRNWVRMDQERKQPKQIPKEKTFHDIRVEMEAQQEENTIDSFWRT